LYYRKHEGQISTRKALLQKTNILRTQFELLTNICPDHDFDLDNYQKLREIRYDATKEFVHEVGKFIFNLLVTNDRIQKFPLRPFRQRFLWEWYCVCSHASKCSADSWKDFLAYHPYKGSFQSMYNSFKLFLQSFRR
jgi:hypothetical protein